MKYRFTITYQTKLLHNISDRLNRVDIGMSSVAITDTFTFTGKDIEVKEMKDIIIKCFAESDLNLLHIEGGKVE